MASTPTSENLPPDLNTPPTPKTQRAALLIVFLVVFIDLLGFGIVLPLLPRYAKQFLPEDLSAEMKGLTIGLLFSCFSLMQFIFSPIWGRISDRVGRRPILLLGLAGSVACYALFGYASTLQGTEWFALGLLFVSRTGAGIAGATVATAQAVIADCTTREKRSSGMALIGAAFGIGFTFGPLLAFAGLTVSNDNRGLPGYLASGLSLIALIIAWKKLPETRKPETRSVHRGWIDPKSLSDVLNLPVVGILVLTYFLATFAFANFEGTLSMLTDANFGYTDRDNFLVFAYVGFILMLAQGYFYRKLAKTMPEMTLATIGIAMMFFGLVQLAGVAATATMSELADVRLVWFLESLGMAVFGFAFINPSLAGLISRHSDPNRQGEILGVNQSFSALARILGPLIGNFLFALESSHLLPYATAAGLLAIIFLFLPKVKRAVRAAH